MKQKIILRYILSLKFILLSYICFAQDIYVKANDEPISKVLIEIRNNYNVNVSFNDRELSKYTISIDEKFANPDEAFNRIVYSTPIKFEKIANVYVFTIQKFKNDETPFLLHGRVVDYLNGESLPFSHMNINGINLISNEFGDFYFESQNSKSFNVKASYLGYNLIDTVLMSGNNHILSLRVSSQTLNEIIIETTSFLFHNQESSLSGVTRMNQKAARKIPGNGDDAVFNVLRLQPGILAAGDQSRELVIWGNYPGFGQINYDGITVFGLKNYNDNISAINPFMTKDIQIFKGGYGATLGDRVGSIINITSVDGSKRRPKVNLNLNNMTFNLRAEAPTGNNSSIVAAYRRTYYNLYPELELPNSNMSHYWMNGNSIKVTPDYTFNDANLKFSKRIKSNNYFAISTFLGKDKYEYSVNQNDSYMAVINNVAEENTQFGVKSLYHHQWGSTGSSQINFTLSTLRKDLSEIQQSSMGMNTWMMGNYGYTSESSLNNKIQKISINIVNKTRLFEVHDLDYGINLIQYYSSLNEVSEHQTSMKSVDSKPFILFIQDRYNLSNKLNLEGGLRLSYVRKQQDVNIQPRIKLRYQTTPKSSISFSWGKYRQYISLISVIDQYDNYSYYWSVNDPQTHPSLTSDHFVTGAFISGKNLSFKVDAYLKETKGVARIIKQELSQTTYFGNVRALGVDFLFRKEHGKHSSWVAYSLSKSTEWFPYFDGDDYDRSIYDQRHEVKLSTILNFTPFYLSANYIFGSGLPSYNNIVSRNYNRVDISGSYRLNLKRIHMEAGISILNLFNYENIKYTNVVSMPYSDSENISIYSNAVPFTPSLYINLSF